MSGRIWWKILVFFSACTSFNQWSLQVNLTGGSHQCFPQFHPCTVQSAELINQVARRGVCCVRLELRCRCTEIRRVDRFSWCMIVRRFQNTEIKRVTLMRKERRSKLVTWRDVRLKSTRGDASTSHTRQETIKNATWNVWELSVPPRTCAYLHHAHTRVESAPLINLLCALRQCHGRLDNSFLGRYESSTHHNHGMESRLQLLMKTLFALLKWLFIG